MAAYLPRPSRPGQRSNTYQHSVSRASKEGRWRDSICWDLQVASECSLPVWLADSESWLGTSLSNRERSKNPGLSHFQVPWLVPSLRAAARGCEYPPEAILCQRPAPRDPLTRNVIADPATRTMSEAFCPTASPSMVSREVLSSFFAPSVERFNSSTSRDKSLRTLTFDLQSFSDVGCFRLRPVSRGLRYPSSQTGKLERWIDHALPILQVAISQTTRMSFFAKGRFTQLLHPSPARRR